MLGICPALSRFLQYTKNIYKYEWIREMRIKKDINIYAYWKENYNE